MDVSGKFQAPKHNNNKIIIIIKQTPWPESASELY
jgi:hypothetical protein